MSANLKLRPMKIFEILNFSLKHQLCADPWSSGLIPQVPMTFRGSDFEARAGHIFKEKLNCALKLYKVKN